MMIKLILAGGVLISGVYGITYWMTRDSESSRKVQGAQPVVVDVPFNSPVSTSAPIQSRIGEKNGSPFSSFSPQTPNKSPKTTSFEPTLSAPPNPELSALANSAKTANAIALPDSFGMAFSDASSTQTAQQPSNAITDHEWVFVTESDGLLVGDLVEPIELELKYEFGTARIDLVDIISLSRAQLDEPDVQGNKPQNISDFDPTKTPSKRGMEISNSPFGPQVEPTAIVQTETSETKTVDTKLSVEENEDEKKSNKDKDVDDKKKSEVKKKSDDNLIVVATRCGNFLVGQCDLPDFKVRTKWGTMTINQSHINMLCSKSGGLRQLANSQGSNGGFDGWMLVPLRLNLVERRFESNAYQIQIGPTPKVKIYSTFNR